MFYLTKTPALLKTIYKSCTWNLSPAKPSVYLTFDDGPHPTATPFILEQLKKYNAKGTFFCIGKNVIEYPNVYQQILEEGHATGNHTHNHLNGWKTNTDKSMECVQNVVFKAKAGSIIVFHDSTKAWDRLEYCLPRVLEYFSKQKLAMEAIPY
jgi:peptidoglycan/xylan/chitin deacetylase (PgdA/CDA1 family)